MEVEINNAPESTPEQLESLEYLLRRSMISRNKQTIILRQDGETTYCCVECPMKYGDKESMELHLCMHNKEYRFICSICGTGLKRKEHLERHFLGHQEHRPHVCRECGKGFKRKEHLNIHTAIHSGEKNMPCPLCDRNFHRKDHLQKHMQSHSKKFLRDAVVTDPDVTIKTEVDDDMNPIITSVFGNAMDSDELAQLHNIKNEPFLAGVSQDPGRPYACVLCPKTYKRKDHLKLHNRTHLKNTCSECGSSFSSEEQLLLHMSSHLTTSSLLESDDDAQLQIVERKRSWQDMTLPAEPPPRLLTPRPALTSERRPHECQICHKRFKRRQHLKVHANVHRRAEPPATIWCSLCNEGFHSNDQFEQHECIPAGDAENMGAPGERAGDVGELGAGDADDGEEQITTPIPIHPQPIQIVDDSSIPVPRKVYVCKFCQKAFRRSDHYKIHLNIHTGVRSFFCPDCGKGFYRKDHLQKHSSVHSRTKKSKKELPQLVPLSLLPRNSAPAQLRPEITIHAPSNAKLRVPLQMKVPYEVVTSTSNGEQRSVVNPHDCRLTA